MCRFLCLALLPVLTLAACAGGDVMKSTPPTAPLAIDGDVGDWQGSVQPVEGKPGVALGITNDSEALYVSLIVRDPDQMRQIARTGLILWLDADGGRDRMVGIRYPVGLAGQLGGGADFPRGQRGEPGAMRDALRERFEASFDEMMLLTDAEEEGARLPAETPSGLRAAASLEFGELVVEYRIPFGDGLGGSLASRPGGRVGVGLVTPEPQRPESRMEAPDPMSPSGGRGAQGRGGQRRGEQGQARTAMRTQASAFTLWTQVDLATL